MGGCPITRTESELRVKPTIWREKERFKGKIVEGVTVILKTRGCAWNRCYMCGYAKDAVDVSEKELERQVDVVLEEARNVDVLKIFTSGSFFDVSEIPESIRRKIIEGVEKAGIKKLIVESRPEFITEKTIEDLSGLSVELEVGIGLESADDKIRETCINKGFGFDDFRKAAKLLRENRFRVKGYLLLKPPFLSESEAISDAVSSAEIVVKGGLADVISLNLTNIQKKTLVERLWRAKLYRPPWLWSAVEALKEMSEKLNVDVICDPVAAGKVRGPHNCGKCDGKVARAIRMFSLTQDTSYFGELNCECRVKWKKALELEKYSRIPLFF